MKNFQNTLLRLTVAISLLSLCGSVWGASISISCTSPTFNSLPMSSTPVDFTPTTYVWQYKESSDENYITWGENVGNPTITGLRANTTYNVKVTASDGLGAEATSSAESYTTVNGPCVTLSLDGSASPTKVPLQWSIYSSCSASTPMTSANINNITITVDDGIPIVLTRSANGGADFPSSYTVAGLDKNTTYRFTIDVYYSAGGEVPVSHSISVSTTGSTGCTISSTAKETLDDNWKGGIDFEDAYTLEFSTSSSPAGVQVHYTVPACVKGAAGVDYESMVLGLKKNTTSESTSSTFRESNGTRTGDEDDGFTWTLSSEDLAWAGLSQTGDSVLIAVNVPVTAGKYCTKFTGYAMGIGCNEAYRMTFTKRTAEQSTFSVSTSSAMIRFAYRKASSTADYTYVSIDNDSGVHSYALNIADFDIGTYEFVIFDKTGVTSGVKVMYTVY